MGIQAAPILNPAIREAFGLPDGEKGVLIGNVLKGSSADGVLRNVDLLMKVDNGSPPPSASAWPGPSSGTTPSFSLQEECSAGLRTIFSRPNHGNIKSPPPPASLQAQPRCV